MPDKQNLEPLLDVAKSQANVVLSTSDSLDSKSLGVLGFNIAIALFTLQSQMENPLLLLLPLLACLLVSALLNIVMILPRDYVGPSVDLEKHPEYLSMGESALLLQLLADTQAATKTNTKLNLTKSRFLITSICLSLAGILLLIGCIL